MEKEKVWIVREVANTTNKEIKGPYTMLCDTLDEAADYMVEKYHALLPLETYAGWELTTSHSVDNPDKRKVLTSFSFKSPDKLYEVSMKVYECELRDKAYYVYAKEIDAFLGEDGKLTPFTSEAMCYDNAETAEEAAQNITHSTGNVFRVVCD